MVHRQRTYLRETADLNRNRRARGLAFDHHPHTTTPLRSPYRQRSPPPPTFKEVLNNGNNLCTQVHSHYITNFRKCQAIFTNNFTKKEKSPRTSTPPRYSNPKQVLPSKIPTPPTKFTHPKYKNFFAEIRGVIAHRPRFPKNSPRPPADGQTTAKQNKPQNKPKNERKKAGCTFYRPTAKRPKKHAKNTPKRKTPHDRRSARGRKHPKRSQNRAENGRNDTTTAGTRTRSGRRQEDRRRTDAERIRRRRADAIRETIRVKHFQRGRKCSYSPIYLLYTYY